MAGEWMDDFVTNVRGILLLASGNLSFDNAAASLKRTQPRTVLRFKHHHLHVHELRCPGLDTPRGMRIRDYVQSKQ